MMRTSKSYHVVKLIVMLLSLVLKEKMQGKGIIIKIATCHSCSVLYYFAARPILALNTISSHGMVCPQATFNCNATDLPSTTLRWFINDDIIASYPYDPSHQFPYDFTPSQSMWTHEVTICILQASFSASSMDRANFHSTLSGHLSMIREMGGHSVSCGSAGTRSNSVNLDSILIRSMYNVQKSGLWYEIKL